MENPASSRRGKCRPGCSDRVRGKKKRARTYRAGVDGCGAGAGRGATTGCAPRDDGCAARDDGSAVPDDGSVARDDGSIAHDDGYTARDDGYGNLKKSSDDGYATLDDGYRVGRRRVLLGR